MIFWSVYTNLTIVQAKVTSRGQHWPNSNSFYCWLMCCCTCCHGNTDMLTMPVGRQSQPTLPQHHTHLQAGEKMQLKHYRTCRWREHERLWIGTKVKRNSQYKEKYTKKGWMIPGVFNLHELQFLETFTVVIKLPTGLKCIFLWWKLY